MVRSVFIFVLFCFFSTAGHGKEETHITSLNSEIFFFRQLPNLKNIDWKVGDFQKRELFKGGLRGGTLHTWIDREQGAAIWILSHLKIIFQKRQFIEVLMDRQSGKILKYIVDGEEQDPPDVTDIENCKVLAEAKVKIKIPAGEFITDRTIAKCDQDVLGIYEADDVNMGGFVKLTVLGADEDPSKPEYTVNLVEFGSK